MWDDAPPTLAGSTGGPSASAQLNGVSADHALARGPAEELRGGDLMGPQLPGRDKRSRDGDVSTAMSLLAGKRVVTEEELLRLGEVEG